MKKNPFEKFADKILKQKDKGDALKKYSIDLSGVLGGDINQKEIQYNEYRKLTAKAKICLSNHLHFWLSKKSGDHSARISMIERDIKISATIIERINNKTYTNEDITKLRTMLDKYSCA